MLDPFLRSVTKDSYGPVSVQLPGQPHAVIHKHLDSFSMYGWGKMPDSIARRGQANSLVFAHLNQWVQSPDRWKEFLRSPDALSFRKAASSIPQTSSATTAHISAMLNELSEKVPARTNYLGVIGEDSFKRLNSKEVLSETQFYRGDLQFETPVFPVCEYFQEEKVPVSTVMGRAIWDYSFWRAGQPSQKIPFEIHCHFVLDEKTLSHLQVDSVALPKTASIATLQAGCEWDFPMMELTLTGHPFQRKIGFSEALWITGWKPEKLQELLLRSAWISAIVKAAVSKSHVKLHSVPLRFAETSGKNPEFILVDSLNLEDLVISHQGRVLGSELDEFYARTSWHEAVVYAQKQALQNGFSEWKRFCVEPAPWLDAKVKDGFEHRIVNLAQMILGKPSCS